MNKITTVLLLLVLTFSTFSQIDLNDYKIVPPQRMVKMVPKAFTQEPYGLDVVISAGPFDNYQVSATNGFAETDIAVNPMNPLHFVATENRLILDRRVFYTTDGGVVWNSSILPSANAGDPAISFDSLGNLYLASLNNNLSGLIIYKSTNGGQSWTPSSVSIGGANTVDKEWIAADQTGGIYKNHVYFAYSNFGAGARPDVWRSTNNGATWSFVTALGTSTSNPGCDIVVGPNGRVCVSWFNGGGTSFNYSSDGGATFSSQVLASFHSTPGNSGGLGGRNVLKNQIRVNGMPHLAVDMSNTSRRGYLYNIYATNPPGPDKADVYCTRSTDGGLTWNANDPVKVNNDATFRDQWMCDVSVDDQGRVWAMWWDSRNDSVTPNPPEVDGNVLTETYGAVSTDGGLTFTNFLISNQNFNPNVIRIGQAGDAYYLGDYQGIAGKTMTLPFYTGQNNTLQDFTAYLPDFGISFNKSIDSVAPNTNSVVLMRNPVMGPYSGTVTYTTSISPSPAPGTINVSFNPGNVRTFTGSADSVTITAAVSGTVPEGLYTVSVTGTETGGPRVHTRSYQIFVSTSIGINNINSEIPKVFSLSQNYPNPFNPVTNIKFGLPKSSLVTLKIFDVLGREVAALINNENLSAGNYVYDFNASNIPSGVYFYKLTADNFSDVKKMMLIK